MIKFGRTGRCSWFPGRIEIRERTPKIVDLRVPARPLPGPGHVLGDMSFAP
ncbi:hypothetical protein [Nannocystis exedens]|uniref:hypothetical protein n=1 Tax=Nannocystis exedens TaxID=54 RepID=UPI0014748CE1|nr:hypothetical protein [Nannocystis exedens]